jgi:hypothetical protein
LFNPAFLIDAFGVIGHQDPRGTSVELQAVTHTCHPGGGGLVAKSLGVDQVAVTQHPDEEVSFPDLAADRIDHGHGVSGKVDEQLVPWEIDLPQADVDGLQPMAVQFTVVAELKPVGVLPVVFLPENAQSQVVVLAQFPVHPGEVRLWATIAVLVVRKQARLQRLIVQILRQWPGKAGHLGPGQVILHRLASITQAGGDLPAR